MGLMGKRIRRDFNHEEGLRLRELTVDKRDWLSKSSKGVFIHV